MPAYNCSEIGPNQNKIVGGYNSSRQCRPRATQKTRVTTIVTSEIKRFNPMAHVVVCVFNLQIMKSMQLQYMLINEPYNYIELPHPKSHRNVKSQYQVKRIHREWLYSLCITVQQYIWPHVPDIKHAPVR